MDMAPDHAGVASGLMNTGFGVAGIVSPIVVSASSSTSTGNWLAAVRAAGVVLLAVGTLPALRVDPRPLDQEDRRSAPRPDQGRARGRH